MSDSNTISNVVKAVVPLVSIGLCKKFGINDTFQMMQITAAITALVYAIKFDTFQKMIYVWYCRIFNYIMRTNKHDVYIYEHLIVCIFSGNTTFRDLVGNQEYKNMSAYISNKIEENKTDLVHIQESFDPNSELIKRYGVIIPKEHKQLGKLFIRNGLGYNNTVVDTYKGSKIFIDHFIKKCDINTRSEEVITIETMNQKLSHYKVSFENCTIIDEYFDMINKTVNPASVIKKHKIYEIRFGEVSNNPGGLFDKKNREENNRNDSTSRNCIIDVNNVKLPMSESGLLLSDVNREIFSDMDKFIDSEGIYASRGEAWTRGYLLYGPPGTGKTSIIQGIASKYSIPIFNLRISLCNNNEDLVSVFTKIREKVNQDTIEKYIVALEDFDKSTFFTKNLMSFDLFYNSINGVVPDSGRILIMTCNDEQIILSHLAICRPGRIDKMYNVSYADETQFAKLQELYDNYFITYEPNKTIAEWKERFRSIDGDATEPKRN
jgi:hypothetical protein